MIARFFMRTRLFCLLVVLTIGLVGSLGSQAADPTAGSDMPQGYRRPSFYGYYPNGVPYQNYPYFQHRGESYRYHQPYYHARPAFGGGFYRPGTPLPPGMRPIGRGL